MPAVPRGRRAGEPLWLGARANVAGLRDVSCINATMDELHVGNNMPKINVLFIIIALRLLSADSVDRQHRYPLALSSAAHSTRSRGCFQHPRAEEGTEERGTCLHGSVTATQNNSFP